MTVDGKESDISDIFLWTNDYLVPIRLKYYGKVISRSKFGSSAMLRFSSNFVLTHESYINVAAIVDIMNL